ncbi:MAG TPA: thiamine pyrophosphate-dependent enzyme [Trebonia sp.]
MRPEEPLPESGGQPSRAEYGSDYVVELMRALGIEFAAFNPGASFRGLHDSLINFEAGASIGIIECTHEEISVAIAHGYAKASGTPMAAVVHNVVGLQHASMAIFNAWVDRIPVYVIGATGPVDSARRRPHIEWMHTANVQGNLVRDYVKFDDQPGSVHAVQDSMLRAWRTMNTTPQGPVYVCLDAELQEAPAPAGLTVPQVRNYVSPTRLAPDAGALAELAARLLAAQDPVILAGSVGRDQQSVPALVELAELLGAPVLPGEERMNIPNTHPLCQRGAEKGLLSGSDLILGLDVTDLQGRTSEVNRTTHEIQSLLTPGTATARIGLTDLSVRSWTHDFQALFPAEPDILADTALAIPMLTEELRRQASPEHHRVAERRTAAARDRHEALRDGWRRQAAAERDHAPVSLAFLTSEVGQLLEGHEWVLGYHSFNPWPTRLWDFDSPWQYASGTSGGGIGYGIGGTIGVALANRGNGKIIVDLQADGDLLYCTSALWTMAQQKLPILMVMHNNRTYYNSEQHQIATAAHRGRPTGRTGIGTQLNDPPVDFGALARSFGVYGEGPVTDPRELRAAVARALKVVVQDGAPALVDVVTAPR